MGKTVVNRPDKHESSARIADGESRTGGAAKEEQSRIPFARISLFFLLGVDIEKDAPLRQNVRAETGYDRNGRRRSDFGIPCQSQRTERIPAPVTVVRGKQKTAVLRIPVR